MIVDLKDVKKYYRDLPHQRRAIEWLGQLLLKTNAKTKFGLRNEFDWLRLLRDDLDWLQLNISEETLRKFTVIWRNCEAQRMPKYFSQRDNSILPYATCNSSAHAMLVNFYKGLDNDESYLSRVFSGKYGRFGKNSSVSWDIQARVVKSFGLDYTYEWKGDLNKLLKVLETGVATVNIYHRGRFRQDRSGGHVILAVDYVDNDLVVLDPFGSRPPNYSSPNNGLYRFGISEFEWRWQGCLGYVRS